MQSICHERACACVYAAEPPRPPPRQELQDRQAVLRENVGMLEVSAVPGGGAACGVAGVRVDGVDRWVGRGSTRAARPHPPSLPRPTALSPL